MNVNLISICKNRKTIDTAKNTNLIKTCYVVNNIRTLILKGSSTVPSVSHAGTPDEASDTQTVGGTGSSGP